ncbi:MAG TPA: oligopeptide/dipeptide ABC transporter ATP-binding protein [Negativicutes bacterium]|nr:oligopeptide/dipeptide ABC transporter ATP-binding protein [Negativicutes bacterium]
MVEQALLEVKNLSKVFSTKYGPLQAVDRVSFTLEKGKTLGLVGESGCGKSTTGRVVLRLIEPTSGTILFDGKDVTAAKKHELHELRRSMQIIFQDPFASLNPRKSISQLIGEPLRWHRIYSSQKEQAVRINQLMETVGLASRLANAYPHELDGGRRQRIGIARALALNPRLIICDEPVSALDVSIQAQILNLLKELQKGLGLSYIFITHDLSVVNHFSNDIVVMYMGQIVEKAPARDLFEHPCHPYTQALLSAIPIPDVDIKRERIVLKGEIASPINVKKDCHFAPRCLYAMEECYCTTPPLVESNTGHFVACHKFNAN